MVTYEAARPWTKSAGSRHRSAWTSATPTARRSTVGTATEVYTYLRVLFARVGHRPCPRCGADVPPEHGADEATDGIWMGDEDGEPEEIVQCPHCNAALPALDMASFSFNQPEGACPTCTGLGTVYGANLPHPRRRQKPGRRGGAGLGSRMSTATSKPCKQPGVTTASTWTRRSRFAAWAKPNATCCCTVWTAPHFDAMSRRWIRQKRWRRGASRAWSPT